MFGKNKNPAPAPTPTPNVQPRPEAPKPLMDTKPMTSSLSPVTPSVPNKPRPAASIISSDLNITGDIETSGDIQIEGHVTGNIRAHQLIVGEDAVIDGEINADDAIINGTVKGKLRGLKVRLSSTARVEGDVIHKTIAIESGAIFEGSVQRAEDPLAKKSGGSMASTAAGAETSNS